MVGSVLKKYYNFIIKPEISEEELDLNNINFFDSKEYYKLQKCPIYFYENFFEIDTIFSPYKKLTHDQHIIIDSFINKNLCVYNYTTGTNVLNSYELICYWLFLNYNNYNIDVHLPTNIHVYNFIKDVMQLNMFVDKRLRNDLIYNDKENKLENPLNNSTIRVFNNSKLHSEKDTKKDIPNLIIFHNPNSGSLNEYLKNFYNEVSNFKEFVDQVLKEKTTDEDIHLYGPMGILVSTDKEHFNKFLQLNIPYKIFKQYDLLE